MGKAGTTEREISGRPYSSRGESLDSVPEDVAREAIRVAAFIACEVCEQWLLSDWQYCPKCGKLVRFAHITDPFDG